MSRSATLKLFQQTSRRIQLQSHITPLTSRPQALDPLCRPFFRPPVITSQALRFSQLHIRPCPPSPSPSTPREFSVSSTPRKGLQPESENPKTPKVEDGEEVPREPAVITEDKYHELSDEYLNVLVEKLEQLQEECEEVDCEYSAGVLTLVFPPNGTYVINKQPPNKQIWLSSPISGPKRYDYVVLSEGQASKEGTGVGEWVYLRDGSTLSQLIEKEIGVDMSNMYAPVQHRGD